MVLVPVDWVLLGVKVEVFGHIGLFDSRVVAAGGKLGVKLKLSLIRIYWFHLGLHLQVGLVRVNGLLDVVQV